MTDKDREKVMEELAVGIVALCIHDGPITEQMGEIKEMIRDHDARIRAQAKTEERQLAAEKEPGTVDGYILMIQRHVRELESWKIRSAAILADELNKEE